MKKFTPENNKAHQQFKNPTAHRLAIFASGGGSNAQQIINYFKNRQDVKVAMVVCNKPGAGVLQIAETENIPSIIIDKEKFFRGDAYVPVLQEAHINLIVLAGFLWKIPQPLIQAFPKKIINIHPALLPKWGGKGMYGQFVHEAVVGAHETESGITIHYVDEQYDHGAVIFQTTCPITPTDDARAVGKKVLQLEHRYYPEVIDGLLKNNEGL